MLAHNPSRSMARKNVPSALPQRFEQIRRAEEQMQRMAEHALPGQSDAERVADRAGRAVAADEIIRLDALARAGREIDDVGGHAGAGVLERIRAATVAQPHARRRQREAAQDRVEPHLRAGLQPHRAVRLRAWRPPAGRRMRPSS